MTLTTPATNGTTASGRTLLTELPGPRSRELHAARERAVPRGFGVVQPVFVDHAEGALLVDVDGNRLIDMASGIAVTSVGAAAPEVASAVAEQAAKFTHTCFMVTEYAGFVDVAEALNRLTPGDHDKRTALFTTGAEAVENAVKIARAHTGRPAVVVLDHAYHGRTLMTMSMTAKNVPYKEGFGPFAPEVYRTPTAYPYRWPSGPERAAEEALAALEEMVLTQIGAHNVACIVAEPIAGEGGFIVPRRRLPARRRRVRPQARHRVRRRRDPDRLRPHRRDVRLRARGSGAGPDHHRQGPRRRDAAVGRDRPRGDHGRRRPRRHRWHLRRQPGRLRGRPGGDRPHRARGPAGPRPARSRRSRSPRLEALRDQYPSVGDARGRGAMLAIEFVRPGTTEPDADAAKAVAASANAQGVLTLTCGTFGNVIRLLPPLVITDAQLDDALSVIEGAVDAMSGPMSDVSHDARTGAVARPDSPPARPTRCAPSSPGRPRLRPPSRPPPPRSAGAGWSRSPTPSRTRGPPTSWCGSPTARPRSARPG